MSEPISREEVNARLEAAEARTETRFIQLVGKIDAIGGQVVHLREDLGGQMAGVLADNKSTRQTIMWVTITAMLTVIAVVIAVQVGLMNAFSAGATQRIAVPTTATAVPSQPTPPAPQSAPNEGHASAPVAAKRGG